MHFEKCWMIVHYFLQPQHNHHQILVMYSIGDKKFLSNFSYHISPTTVQLSEGPEFSGVLCVTLHSVLTNFSQAVLLI